MTTTALSENKEGWLYIRGHSPTTHQTDSSWGGHSLAWYRPAKHPKAGKNIDWEAYLRTITHTVDACVKDALIRSGGKLGKCTVVLDSAGFGLSMMPHLGEIKRLLKA